MDASVVYLHPGATCRGDLRCTAMHRTQKAVDRGRLAGVVRPSLDTVGIDRVVRVVLDTSDIIAIF